MLNVIQTVSYDSIGNYGIVYFNSMASTTDKDKVKNFIRADGAFQQDFFTITKFLSADKLQNKWKLLDDIVLVRFKNPSITKAEVLAFAVKYNVSLFMEPPAGLPLNFNGVYEFKVGIVATKTVTTGSLSADIAKKMWQQDSMILKTAHPNIVNFRRPHNALAVCTRNDTQFNQQWEIINTGTFQFGSSISTAGADAKICDCWDAGYTGQGIKIAVIDFFGFEWTHQDMTGQYLPGWDCINNNAMNSTLIVNNTQAHGMLTSGKIGAIAGNARGVAGIAYSSKIIPMLIQGYMNEIYRGLQQALILQADVVNMSYGDPSFGPDVTEQDLIRELVNKGRPDKFDLSATAPKYGTICIASAGNNNMNAVQYPAGYDEVIGVIGTTPDDKRFRPNDGWGTPAGSGSNYDYAFDISAPGALVWSVDYSLGAGYSTTDYVRLSGTSISSPIVAGVAAIIINKNYGLTWQQVKNAITSTADKVNAGIYNYNANASYPGQSLELSNGRVNCGKALSSVPVGIRNAHHLSSKIRIINPVGEKMLIFVDDEMGKQISVSFYDLMGRAVFSERLSAGSNQAVIDIRELENGVYLIVVDYNGKILYSDKFIKL